MKYVRTQLECVELGLLHYGFFVAGWPADEIVRVPQLAVPWDIRRVLTVGKIVHACVEAHAPSGVTPQFDSWESHD